jgi:hypothetical protein
VAAVPGVPTLEDAPDYFLALRSPLLPTAGVTGWRVSVPSEAATAGLREAVRSSHRITDSERAA